MNWNMAELGLLIWEAVNWVGTTQGGLNEWAEAAVKAMKASIVLE